MEKKQLLKILDKCMDTHIEAQGDTKIEHNGVKIEKNVKKAFAGLHHASKKQWMKRAIIKSKKYSGSFEMFSVCMKQFASKDKDPLMKDWKRSFTDNYLEMVKDDWPREEKKD